MFKFHSHIRERLNPPPIHTSTCGCRHSAFCRAAKAGQSRIYPVGITTTHIIMESLTLRFGCRHNKMFVCALIISLLSALTKPAVTQTTTPQAIDPRPQPVSQLIRRNCDALGWVYPVSLRIAPPSYLKSSAIITPLRIRIPSLCRTTHKMNLNTDGGNVNDDCLQCIVSLARFTDCCIK